MSEFQELKQRLIRKDIDYVIDQLQNHNLTNSRDKKALDLLKSRWNTARGDFNIGTLSREDYSTETLRISSSLLDLIKEVGARSNSRNNDPKFKNINKKNNRKIAKILFWVCIWGLVLIIPIQLFVEQVLKVGYTSYDNGVYVIIGMVFAFGIPIYFISMSLFRDGLVLFEKVSYSILFFFMTYFSSFLLVSNFSIAIQIFAPLLVSAFLSFFLYAIINSST